MFIKEENLLEELSEEVRQIVDTSKEYGLNNKETAFAVACYEYFDFTFEEVLEMIERNVINVSEYNPNLVENDIWSVEAYVFNNQQEAEYYAKDGIKELVYEIDIEGFNNIDDFVDQDWFKDVLVESFEYYCRDIVDEEDDTYGNRLVEECFTRAMIDEDDFAVDENGNIDYTACILDTEELVDRYTNWYEIEELDGNYGGDYVRAYIDIYGNESFLETVKEYTDEIIDMDKLVDYCIEEDGLGHYLASYDGNEYKVEIGDGTIYYVYRTN